MSPLHRRRDHLSHRAAAGSARDDWPGRRPPQVRPVGFAVDPATGTIDIGGYSMAASRKFRNVAADPRVSLVVDDLASRDPWRPRALEVRGVAEALHGPDVIRIHPRRILVFGLEDDGPGARTVGN